MSDPRRTRQKTHMAAERPPFERTALILQGGGALGSYQAGVYQALAEANLHPDWVAGISIGAVNSALIAVVFATAGSWSSEGRLRRDES
jgi:NTE family protein